MREIHDHEMLIRFIKENNIAFSEELLPHLHLYRFDQGDLICSQGDPADMLYVLVKGKVKVFTTSPEGRTLILSFKKPLEVIGDIEYVRGTETMNTVEAVSRVEMIGVHHRWLKKYAAADPAFLEFLLHIITNKFYVKSNSMQFNLLYPVEVRLASYLLSVSYDSSSNVLKKQHSSASLRDAANLIGTSYRHMNRVLQQFCANGFIERVSGGIMVIDRAGLTAIAGNNIYE
ncbi:Crp/Fnr family transcriptional regulator [Fictibacillus aquaticus]|uniref:Crp/Fnr family transcriptional regulator n=1 Tax=Fictibacillus aquaticus TaxID=2021314 RepID=A0A235F6B7_9BACL|nr:cyclic nucleotide-binding domain-containing protein [Fictibacillus aquaticus]OYD56820.1 Crp/Fnr family transcriptional regulator [Fictibacillus aquaticus]